MSTDPNPWWVDDWREDCRDLPDHDDQERPTRDECRWIEAEARKARGEAARRSTP